MPTSILDTYLIFIKVGVAILKEHKLLGYIIPSTWLYMNQFKSFRFSIINSLEIKEILSFKNQIFLDATVETCIVILNKLIPDEKSNYNFILKNYLDTISNETINQLELLNDENYTLTIKNNKFNKIYKKVTNNVKLNEISKIVCGLTPYRLGKGKPIQTKEIVENRSFDSKLKMYLYI